MSEKVLLSFVIPVYNVEKYLNECLDSIFDPSVSEEEYEVIAVDDGSTDGSPEILKTYTHHKNFRIITQENAGQGAARNPGINGAKGEYIHFTDSDDYLLPGAVPTLLDFARESDCDIVEFEFEMSYDLPNPAWNHEPKTQRAPTSGEGKVLFSEWIKQGAFFNAPWMRIYKKSFLITNSLYFSDLRISGNDAEWQVRCFFYAQKINYYPVFLYNYRVREGSVTLLSKGSKYCYDLIQLITALNEFGKEIEQSTANFTFLAELNSMLVNWFEELINIRYKAAPKSERKLMFEKVKNIKEVFDIAIEKKGKRICRLVRWLPGWMIFGMYRILK